MDHLLTFRSFVLHPNVLRRWRIPDASLHLFWDGLQLLYDRGNEWANSNSYIIRNIDEGLCDLLGFAPQIFRNYRGIRCRWCYDVHSSTSYTHETIAAACVHLWNGDVKECPSFPWLYRSKLLLQKPVLQQLLGSVCLWGRSWNILVYQKTFCSAE